MIRQLQPWHANLKKRQVKAPKIYFRDTGLLHELLGIHSEADLLNHPKSGASWEGYVVEEILRAIEPNEAFFWATHTGAEIDLVLIKDGHMLGVECKHVDAPRMTPSIRIALEDLQLERIAVVYPGTLRYPIADRVEAVPFQQLLTGCKGCSHPSNGDHMTLSEMLNLIPDYHEFLTLEELHQSSVRLVEEFPQLARPTRDWRLPPMGDRSNCSPSVTGKRTALFLGRAASQ